MFELKIVVNKDIHNEANVKMTSTELDEVAEKIKVEKEKYYHELDSEQMETEEEEIGRVAITCHPFYDWVETNVNSIHIPLFKAIITNIVPIGESGKTFFTFIANLKTGFTDELLKLYESAEKKYENGKLKPIPCWAMYKLGYTGEVMKSDCPVYDVLEFLSKQEEK